MWTDNDSGGTFFPFSFSSPLPSVLNACVCGVWYMPCVYAQAGGGDRVPCTLFPWHCFSWSLGLGAQAAAPSSPFVAASHSAGSFSYSTKSCREHLVCLTSSSTVRFIFCTQKTSSSPLPAACLILSLDLSPPPPSSVKSCFILVFSSSSSSLLPHILRLLGGLTSVSFYLKTFFCVMGVRVSECSYSWH